MIAAVRSVICASRSAGSRPSVSSISANTGTAAADDDRVDRRDERERGHDHLVAAPDAQGRERAPQRRGAVRDGDRVAAAEQRARGAFELGDRAPVSSPPL